MMRMMWRPPRRTMRAGVCHRLHRNRFGSAVGSSPVQQRHSREHHRRTCGYLPAKDLWSALAVSSADDELTGSDAHVHHRAVTFRRIMMLFVVVAMSGCNSDTKASIDSQPATAATPAAGAAPETIAVEPEAATGSCTAEHLATLGATTGVQIKQDTSFPLSFVGFECSGSWAMVHWQNEAVPDAQGRWLIDLNTDIITEFGGPMYTPIGLLTCAGVGATDAAVLGAGFDDSAGLMCNAVDGTIVDAP